ncbi:MAG: class I SAM-dependent methyltransferase [Acidimicrobiales bacterium]
MELAPGVVTPGIFDLRPTMSELPWPDVEGRRCLDLATFDGFFAFELERRGAAEVIAIDIPDLMSLDWTFDSRPETADDLPGLGFPGARTGGGFRVAANALGSSVAWRAASVYDLNPADIGTFDVVFCGSILVHLRDPLRALEAIRRVCRGVLLSSEPIDPWLQLLALRRPVFRLDGSRMCQWWSPNAAGHERLLWAAGFDTMARSRPHVAPYNADPRASQRGEGLRGRAAFLASRAIARTMAPGVLQQAIQARPRHRRPSSV